MHDPVQIAKAHIEEIDVPSLQSLMNKGSPFYLLDIREEDEWQEGHLPHAHHWPMQQLLEEAPSHLSLEATIVLYCGGGFRSAVAAYELKKKGYTHVLSLQGGIGSWIRHKFPVVV